MPAIMTRINRRPIESLTAAPTMVFDETPSLVEAGGEAEPEPEEVSVSLGVLPLDDGMLRILRSSHLVPPSMSNDVSKPSQLKCTGVAIYTRLRILISIPQLHPQGIQSSAVIGQVPRGHRAQRHNQFAVDRDGDVVLEELLRQKRRLARQRVSAHDGWRPGLQVNALPPWTLESRTSCQQLPPQSPAAMKSHAYLGQQVMIISGAADTAVLVTLLQAEAKPCGQMLAGE